MYGCAEAEWVAYIVVTSISENVGIKSVSEKATLYLASDFRKM